MSIKGHRRHSLREPLSALSAWSAWQPSEIGAALASVCLLAAFLAASVLHPGKLERFLSANGGADWFTFFAFAGAGLAALGHASLSVMMSRRRIGLLGFFVTVVVGSLCLVAALDEIAWGRELLPLLPAGAGRFLAMDQLRHNASLTGGVLGLDHRYVAASVAGLYGVLAVGILPWIGNTRLRSLGHAVPSPLLAPAFAAVAVAALGASFPYIGEGAECALAAILLIHWSSRLVTLRLGGFAAPLALAAVVVLGALTPLVLQQSLYSGAAIRAAVHQELGTQDVRPKVLLTDLIADELKDTFVD